MTSTHRHESGADFPRNQPLTAGVKLTVLEVRNLTKCYNNISVVERVSFVIRPGEILGYLGPNGAGKSTTVKMLAGLIEPTSGSIEFNGQDVRADLKAFQRRLGYVPEEPHLYPHLSGREYLQLVGRLRGIARRLLEPKTDSLLRLLGLWEDRLSPLASYSKGMRQKILLLAALLHDPQIMILDEPFSGLDVNAAMILRSLLRSLAERKKSSSTAHMCSRSWRRSATPCSSCAAAKWWPTTAWCASARSCRNHRSKVYSRS